MFDKLEAINIICDQPRDNVVETIKAVDLTVECRIIHHVIGYCLIPKSGTREQVTELELYLIWAIWVNRPLDWTNIIFQNLGKGIKRKDGNCPYGITLTSLFNYLNVDLSNEEGFALVSGDFYNTNTMNFMGFYLDDNTQTWRKKKD